VMTEILPYLSSRVCIRLFAPIGQRSGEIDVHLEHVDVWSAPVNLGSRIWTGYGPEVARRVAEFVAGCDVVHIHELWHYAHYVAWRAARHRNIPVIVSPHGALDAWVLRYKGLRKKVYSALFQRRALREATFVQALTPHEAEMIARFGVSQDRIRLIPNALPEATVVRLAEMQKGKQPERESNGARRANVYGLFLGRLHPTKGLDLLVRALPQIVAKYPDIRIVVAGPDECGHRACIERQAQVAGVRDRLIFRGLLKGHEKWDVLAKAKFFVLPSYSEGFSMAILEALAAGIPVVATRVCEVGTLEQSHAAILVDPNPEALAAGIDQVLSSPELARQLAENGRRLVLDHYTWERVAAEMMRMYEDAIELARAEGRANGFN